MNKNYKKLEECKDCPFEEYEINQHYTKLGYGKLGAHFYQNSDNSIMVVGQNPSHRRYKGTHSMEGKQGDIFREIFGIDRLVFSNFIQISTPDNTVNKLSDKQINHCINHLFYDIEEVKPKTIIVCSQFAKKKLKELNRMDELTLLCENVFFTKHPDYYLTYNPTKIKDYYKELYRIKEYDLHNI